MSIITSPATQSIFLLPCEEFLYIYILYTSLSHTHKHTHSASSRYAGVYTTFDTDVNNYCLFFHSDKRNFCRCSFSNIYSSGNGKDPSLLVPQGSKYPILLSKDKEAKTELRYPNPLSVAVKYWILKVQALKF
jgi:hypothetical protein